MEEALVARMVGVAPIAAIIGDRAAWFERPRADGLAALTFTKVTPGREWTHDGPDGLDRPTVQFDCWGLSDAEVAALARAVLAEMETLGEVTVAEWTFHEAQLEFENWSVEDLDGDVKVFRAQLDFSFYHHAAV
jgi:hypothetical protein